MNNKTGLTLRLILGGYLVFLWISVIVQTVQAQPSDMVIKTLFGVLFIGVGGAYAIAQIKKVYHIVKKETEESEDAETKKSTQPLFQKPQHDESLYRTAPMPSEEIAKKMPAQSTDLRANMNRMREEEKEAAAQSGQNEEKEQSELNESKKAGQSEEKKQSEQNENKETVQNKEQTEEKKPAPMEVKDPVNLAIEIMRSEDKALAEQAEELEKDYEEK